MVLISRIEQYVGTLSDATAASQWLRDGARVVIQALPPHLLWTVAADLADSGSGVSVAGAKVLYAHVSGRRARLFPAAMKAALTDAKSIHKATDFSPAFYLENGKAFVVGDAAGGTVVAVAYPNPTYAADSIENFPEDLEHIVILYAASQARLAQAMAVVIPDSPELISAPAAPTLEVPSISTPTYSAPAKPTIPEPPAGVNLTLPEAPTGYVAPSLSMPETPTLAQLDLTTGLSVPTPPSAPSISYEDAASTAPSATTVGSVLVPPAYTGPTVSPDFTKYDAAFADDDSEMASVALSKIQRDLEDYGLEIQNAANSLQAAIETYRGDLQTVIEQARISAQEAAQTAQQATDVAVQNKARKVEAELRNYELSLRRYDAEVREYEATVNSRIAEHTANVVQTALVKWQTEAANALRQYEAEIQAAVADARADVDLYQATVQALVREFEATNQVNLSSYTAELQGKLEEYRADLQAASEALRAAIETARIQLEEASSVNQSAVLKYREDVQAFQYEVAQMTQKYATDINRFSALRQQYLEDSQALLAQFQAGLKTFVEAA